MPLIADVIGWVGTALILGAFTASSWDLVSPGAGLLLANALGGVGVAIVCVYRRAWQPLFINLVWVAVAVIGLLRT